MEFSEEKRIDNLGRIVVPKNMRQYFKMKLNSKVKLIATENGILITPCETSNCEDKER